MSGQDRRRPHRGQVVRADGSPAPGAIVAVARGTAPTPEIAIRADAKGRFIVALPPGRFVLRADGATGGRGIVEVEVGEAGAAEIRITLAPPP